jgi:hypothetical protein
MAALRRPEVTNLPSIQQAKERDPVRWLRDHVKVDFPGNAEIMLISCTCSDPKEAAVLARTVVEAYMGEVVEKEKSQKVARYFDLVKICDAKESEIRSKRQELVNLVGPNGGVAGGEVLSIKQKLMLEELSYLTHGFAKTQFEMNKLQADLAGQKAMLKSAEKSADGKSSHAIEMEVVKLEAVLLTMQQQQSVSQAAIAKMRGAAETFGNAGLDVEMLRAEVKRLESALAIFSAERERLDAEKRAPSRVTVLENAEVPLSKD